VGCVTDDLTAWFDSSWSDTVSEEEELPPGCSSSSEPIPDSSDGTDGSDAYSKGSALLADTAAWFATYTRTRLDCGPDLLALWTMHSHLMDQWWSSPRLFVTSALPGCGKTTILDHLERLTPNPMMGSQATPALIARVVSAQQTTVLLDETDNLLSNKKDGTPDLLATLNSGYRRGGNRPVLDPKKGGGWEAKSMSTFAAVALAGIGDHLPDAVLSRSITLRLDRANEGEVSPSDWRRIEPFAHALRDSLSEWAEANADHVAEALDAMPTPPGLHGRDLEVWEPLLAIGYYVGQGWLERAEHCRTEFTRERDLDSQIGRAERPGLRLLKATRQAWHPNADFMETAALLSALAIHDPESWGDEAPYGRLKAKRLANLLAEFGVRPHHSSDKTKRGYHVNQFTKAWERYAPTDPPESASDPSHPSDQSGGF
jgi:hypothetical protein